MVSLKEMSNEEYQVFDKASIGSYAKDFSISNECSIEDATKFASKQFQNLLPDKINTKDHFLYSICDNESIVGWLWIAYSNKLSIKSYFIYDVFIFQEHRTKGIGSKAIKELEKKSLEFNVKKIDLHVFASNSKAYKFYQKLGFCEKSTMMSKIL